MERLLKLTGSSEKWQMVVPLKSTIHQDSISSQVVLTLMEMLMENTLMTANSVYFSVLNSYEPVGQ